MIRRLKSLPLPPHPPITGWQGCYRESGGKYSLPVNRTARAEPPRLRAARSLGEALRSPLSCPALSLLLLLLTVSCLIPVVASDGSGARLSGDGREEIVKRRTYRIHLPPEIPLRPFFWGVYYLFGGVFFSCVCVCERGIIMAKTPSKSGGLRTGRSFLDELRHFHRSKG